MQNLWEPRSSFPKTRLSHLWVMGERWGAAVNPEEASLTGLLLTSCSATWFYIDQGMVLILVPVLWIPALTQYLGHSIRQIMPLPPSFLTNKWL